MITKTTVPLEEGNYYHIYNHANGNDKVFFSEENYRFFLVKYQEYISPMADTFAYCLMPNHFHFLVKIKEEVDLFTWLKANGKISEVPQTLSGFGNTDPFSLLISRQFSHFFNSYAQAINKQENRIGSLFARPFKRKKITSEKQLRYTLIYIHNNPINHGFVVNVENWIHSSFHTFLGERPTMLKRNEAIEWFGNKENFLFYHKYYSEVLIDENEIS